MSQPSGEDPRAIYAKRLHDLQDVPAAPSPVEPYGNPVGRFAHLPIHTRSFLQALEPRDVATLAAVIVNTQRTGTALRIARKLFIWAIGAIAFGVSAGQNVEKILGWGAKYLW